MHRLRVAVVGAGPAGFYTASALLRRFPNCNVDLLERMPVPFGLVRYGVAVDHFDTRKVTAQFSALIRTHHPRLQFYGNVHVRPPSILCPERHRSTGIISNQECNGVGDDDDSGEGGTLSAKRLDELYHATIWATGASSPRRLDKSVDLPSSHVYSAHDLSLWLNGHPDVHTGGRRASVGLSLAKTLMTSAEKIVIIGTGNVAVDIARIFLLPREALKQTDVSESALRVLQRCQPTRHVTIVGRRSPRCSAWTAGAMRELSGKLSGVAIKCDDVEDVALLAEDLKTPDLTRRERRMLDVLRTATSGSTRSEAGERATNEHAMDLEDVPNRQQKVLSLKFCHSVSAIRSLEQGDHKDGLVCVTLSPTQARKTPTAKRADAGGVGRTHDNHRTVAGDLKKINADAVFLSLGYEGNPSSVQLENVTSVGWANGAARGTIADNKWDAETVIASLQSLDSSVSKPGLQSWLCKTRRQVVTWAGWERIQHEEMRRGARYGRPGRCIRIESVREMLDCARGIRSSACAAVK